jgi:glycosyltransferase involved in cell wall biosynthesis
MFDTGFSRTTESRLRIVHCVRAPIGGIFRHVLDLATEQSARGHLVGIVLDSTTGGSFEAQKIAEASPHLALGVTRLPMTRSITPTDLLSACRVYAAVHSLAPDVLHGHGAKGGAFARLAGTLLSTPSRPVARFYTPHGGSLHYDESTLKGRILFGLERIMERMCDGIIHVSRYEANAYLHKLGRARCHAPVIVNGLRPEEFTLIEPHPEASDLVFMGMMRDLKGPDVLIRAVALIRDRLGVAPTLTMIGDGPDRDGCRNLVRSLDLTRAVTFHDPLPTREGLAMGRVLVVPSRAESMPYIVLESAAAGVPVVASCVGGIREILGHNAAGLVQPGNVAGLATVLHAVLSAPSEATMRAMAARRALRDRFTLDTMASSVEALYRTALARRRAAATPYRRSILQPAE